MSKNESKDVDVAPPPLTRNTRSRNSTDSARGNTRKKGKLTKADNKDLPVSESEDESESLLSDDEGEAETAEQPPSAEQIMNMRVPDIGKSEHRGKTIAELIETKPDWVYLMFESNLEALKEMLKAAGQAFWEWVDALKWGFDEHKSVKRKYDKAIAEWRKDPEKRTLRTAEQVMQERASPTKAASGSSGTVKAARTAAAKEKEKRKSPSKSPASKPKAKGPKATKNKGQKQGMPPTGQDPRREDDIQSMRDEIMAQVKDEIKAFQEKGKEKSSPKKTKLGDLSMTKNGLAKKIITGRPTLQKTIDVIAGIPEKVLNEEDARAMIKYVTTLQAQVDELQENHNADARRKDKEVKDHQAKAESAHRAKARATKAAHEVELQAAKADLKYAEAQKEKEVDDQERLRTQRDMAETKLEDIRRKHRALLLARTQEPRPQQQKADHQQRMPGAKQRQPKPQYRKESPALQRQEQQTLRMQVKSVHQETANDEWPNGNKDNASVWNGGGYEGESNMLSTRAGNQPDGRARRLTYQQNRPQHSDDNLAPQRQGQHLMMQQTPQDPLHQQRPTEMEYQYVTGYNDPPPQQQGYVARRSQQQQVHGMVRWEKSMGQEPTAEYNDRTIKFKPGYTPQEYPGRF